MVKLKSVEYGYAPFGPSSGTRTFYISFIDEELPEGTEVPTPEDWAVSTLKGIEEMIQEIGKNREWEEALLSQVHIIFNGEALARRANIPYSNKLLETISVASLNRQKGNVAVHKLRPPYFIFHGKAINFTQPLDFYENFQLLLVELPVDAGISDETLTKYFKVNSVIEMSNHSFSSFLFRIANGEDVKRMEKFYLEEGWPSVDVQRIHVVPANETEESITATIAAAEKHKLRLWVDAAQATRSNKYLTFAE
jgi:hypothetical protein